MYVTKRMGCIILMLRNFRYYLKSAVSSFVRNGIMTLTSFVTVTCALFLFGVFLLFVLNLNYISRQIQSQCELQAYINIAATTSEQQHIYEKILDNSNVASAQLETKEQALFNYKNQLGENAGVLEGLEGQDFLRPSIKITLRNLEQSEKTAEEISHLYNIDEVKNRQDIIEKVVKFADVVEKGSAIAMLILLIIAVFIIKNTIKLSVFAREKEIHIMKFVGATDRFIRTPFVLEGILIGTLSFIMSFVVIVLGYGAVIASVSGLINLFEYLPLNRCILPLGISMGVFGILMGAIGSGISLKKHLKV